MRFCGGCGSPLASLCPSCGVENPRGFRFCGQCAAALDGALRPERTTADAIPAANADRRQVTVLFCDLVGSTQLSDRLDPEELREVVREYQRVSGEVVEHYEGHVAQYLGDGLLIYFGYPHAHEDDARRAVSAGLEIIEAVRGLNGRHTLEFPLAVRIGIHTGFGVAGDVGGPGRREQLVIGRTPNIAARLQGLAAPDTLVITQATQKLVVGCFILESVGLQSLKGIEEPLEVFRVIRELGSHERSEVARLSRLSPLMGRERELSLMYACLEHCKRGQGQVLLVSAEAGMGKSRLVLTLEQRVRGEARMLIGRCLPYGQNQALLPLRELFQSLLGLEVGATREQKLGQVLAFLGRQAIADTLPLSVLAAFFSLPLPEGHAPVMCSPHMLREQTRRLLIHLLLLQARTGPLVLVIENLHWADPSTLEFLDELVEAASSAPILTLLTARPSFQTTWKHRPYFTSLTLPRLEDDAAGRLIREMAGTHPLPVPVVRQILDKADGVPLFIEELTRATLESGMRGPLSIPATLRDSLMARLDRLGPVKEVAQLASVIGRRFCYLLLSAVSSLEPLVLRRHLDQLLEAGLIWLKEAASPGRLEAYQFKHALIQEAAYESILKTRRREMHARIARTLEANFPDVTVSDPEVLARHHEEAGHGEKAAGYLLRAGRKAVQRAAYAEAITSLSHALELVPALPEAESRDRLELELRISLGAALIVTRGYCAPEVERNAVRARELCARLQESAERVPVLFTLWLVSLTGSRREEARDYSCQLLEFARAHPGELREVPALSAHAITLYFLGRFEEARIGLQRALKRYVPMLHSAMVHAYGEDPGLYALVYLEMLNLMTGDIEQARELLSRSLALADALEDPLAQVLVCDYASDVFVMLREPVKALEFAERSMAICIEQGFTLSKARGRVCIGWACAMMGKVQEGIQELENGLAFFGAIQQKIPLTYFLAMLADIHLANGEAERGAACVEQALAYAETNLDRFYLPELCRLKGELLRLSGAPVSDVQVWLERAVAEARESGAAWLELRAARSLAGLLRERGDLSRAREFLITAMDRIRGGEDTRDYREALQLLGELEPPAAGYSE